MPEYVVRWEISLDASDAEAAAIAAQTIQRDPDSSATVFAVAECDSESRYGRDVHGWRTVDLCSSP